MTFLLAISLVIIFSTAASGWEHRGPIIAREEPREYAAWYQMPQGAAAYPPSAYERAVAASAAASQYAGYPRPYSRSPDYYPETAVTNNMVPASRKAAAAAGYYIPAGANTPDPNAELISAIKDVVRKFKASLDRTGVNDDVRHMQSQLESTWNDLRRGINRSWTAFRQSAENALLSPSLSTSSSSSSALTTLQQPPIILPPGLLPPLPPPSPGTLLTGEPYPYIITALQQQQQLKHHSFMKDSNIYGSAKSNNNNNNTDTNTYLQNDINNNSNNVENVDAMLLYNGSSYGSSGKSQSKRLLKKQKISPFTELLLQNLYDSNIDDSGKLESWIERAHQMLADSVSEDDVKAILDSQKNDGPSKIAKNPTQIPKDKPVKASSSVIKAEKINPKFNLNDQN